MNKKKRIISMVLIFLMTFLSLDINNLVFASAAETDIKGNVQQPSAMMTGNDIEMSSESSIGSLVLAQIDEILYKQAENSGYNIFEVTVTDNKTKVSFETLEDCQVVVGIYNEEGTQLLASGAQKVKKGDKAVYVTLEGIVPDYFLVKGFLVNDDLAPLCSAYESKLYTQEMQEFLAKTTDDFEEEKVLNLDEDKNNNFAVYKDTTKVIAQKQNVNQVVLADNEANSYVIENVDESITSLREGEIFAYTYDDTVLIIKVATIKIEGTTANIIGQETSLEEVFDYVKFDNTSSMSDVTVNDSNLEEGIIYNGMVEESEEELVQAGAEQGELVQAGVDISGSYSKSVSISFSDKIIDTGHNSVELSGGLMFGIEASVKVYLTFSEQYVEVKLDFTSEISIAVSGKVEKTLELVELSFSPVVGLYIKLTPSFIFEAEAKIEISGKLTTTAGFEYDGDSGFKNLCAMPKFTHESNVEGTVFLGFSLEPKIVIVTEKLGKVGVTAKAGVELSANLMRGDNADDLLEKIHCCQICIEGEVKGKLDASCGLELFNNDKYKLEASLVSGLELKIADYYYSCTYKDGGFTVCPHYAYKVALNIKNSNGNVVQGAYVTVGENTYIADEDGQVCFYLESGEYSVDIQKESYRTTEENILVSKNVVKKDIILHIMPVSGDSESEHDEVNNKIYDKSLVVGDYRSAVITEDGSLYMWGINSSGELGNGNTKSSSVPIKVLDNVVKVSLGNSHSGAITTDGSLYMWGNNSRGQLGTGSTENSLTPVKVLDNVSEVSLERVHSGAITTDGSLYMWGDNSRGQLGTGDTEDSLTPVKVLDNVSEVSLEHYRSGAVTTDGSLYMWGDNGGQLGTGDTEDSLTPVKVLDNVSNVSLERFYSGAVTTDGSLYMWGNNSSGQLGTGDTEDSLIPVKVLDNVVKVSLGNSHSGAITTNGSLYMWGNNSSGQLGTGSTESSLTPVKVLDNVEQVSLGDSCSSGAITTNGKLYMWGRNYYGQLGIGSTEDSLTPVKVLDNVEQVSLGDSCSSGAVTTKGELYMWGYNYYLMGNWGTENIGTGTVPVKIMDNVKLPQSISTSSQADIVTSGVRSTELQVQAYDNLIPNSEYMFYVMKSDTDENLLERDNLLYLNQASADKNGKLKINYILNESYDNPIIRLVESVKNQNGGGLESYTGMIIDENTGKRYWYDNGVLARDKQVYDPATNAWYWFDADGTMAVNKDVYVPESNENRENGKWVRYDENGGMVKGEDFRYGGWYRFDETTGEMIKGWYTTDNGTKYYYNNTTGQMEHGAVEIDGKPCAFDDVTGAAVNCSWYKIDGNEYWYEGGIRQGLEGRGKEIYDPASDAWYWLDSIDGGKKAVSKDVYQESYAGIFADREDGTGKWVRYDAQGHMIKGWSEQNGSSYYFDMQTGAMAKGEAEIDGVKHYFNMATGIQEW